MLCLKEGIKKHFQVAIALPDHNAAEVKQKLKKKNLINLGSNRLLLKQNELYFEV